MSMELVLFDKNGKEIGWYDPVSQDTVKETRCYLIVDNGFGIYRIHKKKYYHYIIRELNTQNK